MSQQIPARFAGGAVDLSHLASRGQQPQGQSGAQVGGGGQVVDVPALVFALTDQSFEQVAQLSAVVPVVIALLASEDPASAQLAPVLDAAVREHGGRLVLAQVEASTNPGLMQAFQAQAVPTVVALIAGRPVPLFQGPAGAEQIRELFTQLLQLGEQQGVSGRVNAPDSDPDAAAAPAGPPVNPAHAEGLEALERGDFAAAVQAYEQVLAKAPADHEARAALVQARLLLRLQGANAAEVRNAAAADLSDIEAQLLVADLDLSGGHIEDAFLRLLDVFVTADTDDRTRIRERLLELFEVVGLADPRVIKARAQLANLLY
ncbi:MAG: tetratricopeptide repeat protein [Actinobacteria bacterium]|jgi:putative thioredoxin|nr:tetratricopeptide repeat protein [Actinomycetota bacterium]